MSRICSVVAFLAVGELGQSLPTPNANATDPEMDFEEPIYLHLSVSSEIEQTPAGEVAS